MAESLWEEVEPPVETGTALEHVDTSRLCPTCAGALLAWTLHEPAMFFHGGYGATRLTARRFCPECRWSLVVEVSEERP